MRFRKFLSNYYTLLGIGIMIFGIVTSNEFAILFAVNVMIMGEVVKIK